MEKYVFFLLLGTGSGAVFALLAIGLLLKYRSSGVIDFGHGAVAMFAAYVFLGLRSSGTLELPWVVIPHQIALTGTPFATVPAILVALLYSGIAGLLLYGLIYRPLRHASQLVRVCASVGTMLYLQAIAVLNFGTTTQSTPAILPSGPVSLFGLPAIPAAFLWLSGVAIALTAAVAALYRFSHFGLATRAAAENEEGAAVSGLSAVRIATGNWILATMLAGFAGVMIAPLETVNPTSYTLFIVPVLGVALVARFRSFGIACAGAFALAMFQTELSNLPSVFPDLSTGLQQGIPPALPFVVIIVAILFVAPKIRGRGEVINQRNPSLGAPRRPYITTAGAFLAGLVPLLLLSGPYGAAYMYSLALVCVALSLVVLTGYVGQVSLAQMSLAGVSAILLTHFAADSGIGFPFTMLIASFAAIPVGFVVGLPALRVRGVNLAVVTLATAYLIEDVFTNWTGFVGGLAGRPVAPPSLFGIDLGIGAGDAYPRFAFGVLALAVVCLVGLMVARLRRGPTGRAMIAVRSNERAAAAAGINVARTKLFAFVLSAWIAGLGGCLLAYQSQTVAAAPFSIFNSLGLLAIVMVAGIGRISGAVVAGVMLAANGLMVTFLNDKLGIGDYQLVVAGLALILTAVANPDGIAANPPPPLIWAHRRFEAWLAARRGTRIGDPAVRRGQ
jgi:ABC-type branched-subunit amino acid transport system permease subunit